MTNNTFRFSAIEKPTNKPPSLREIFRDLSPAEIGNGLVAILFSASGPLAVILQGAANGGLTSEQSTSWIFATFLGNGLLTLFLTWYYRSPQAYGWTIPGTVLAADALLRFSYAEVIGTYLLTGILVLLLGWTGVVRWIMKLIPYPVVMAMVAGVFLSFGIELINATMDAPGLGGSMIAIFIIATIVPKLGSALPPALAAIIVGTIYSLATGQAVTNVFAGGIIGTPVFTAPEFNATAMLELVIPLAITVIIVQNGQGVAVLTAAGHRQDANLSAFAAGLWTIPQALMGSVPTALTGPTNAMVTSSPDHHRHYTAALTNGAAGVVIGLFAPVSVTFMMGMPPAFIAVLAGLAMLTPLQNAFIGAFSGPYPTGALVCLLVTITNITLLGISAPFWGILFGCLVGYLMDHKKASQKA